MQHRIIVLAFMATLCWSCAQQGSPSGGPRDQDPPVVLECSPSNYSVHFNARKIEVTFDEYIVLDNVNQELVVSPPMKEKPEVKLRKRTMIIELVDSLKTNTTYTFNFGSAIKDLHEGNKLLNYEYVFSTGAELDSLSLKGSLKYAEDLSVPVEPIAILLYTDLHDSVPLRDIPLYVGRSNDSGVFSVNNLRVAEYKVFALKDGNNNFLYDLPSEEIAFADSTLILDPVFIRKAIEEAGGMNGDSLLPERDSTLSETFRVRGRKAERAMTAADSTLADHSLPEADSTLADSLAPALPDYNSVYIDLMLFTEEVLTQYLVNNTRDQRRLIQLTFAQPLTDSFAYHFLRPRMGTRVEVLENFSSGRDSLDLWLRDSLDFKQDSLHMEIRYTMLDSSKTPYTQIDTLLFSFRDQTKGKGGRTVRGKKPLVKKEKLTLETIRKSGNQDLNRSLKIELNFPLLHTNDSMIHLYSIPDTVPVPVDFSVKADQDNPCRIWIDCSWESMMDYQVQVLPGAIRSIYELDHDTLDVKFKTRDFEYYGQILLNLDGVRHPVLVQLKAKDKVLREIRVEQDGQVAFPYLHPGEYSFKIIHDLNDNGKWDTGNYLQKIQPEPVEIIKKTVKVRSNWDHELQYELKH